jgi:hypothetical protein
MKTGDHQGPAGLCRTCDMAATCTYPNRNGHVVLHCLEFEEASMEDGAGRPTVYRMKVGTGVGEVHSDH